MHPIKSSSSLHGPSTQNISLQNLLEPARRGRRRADFPTFDEVRDRQPRKHLSQAVMLRDEEHDWLESCESFRYQLLAAAMSAAPADSLSEFRKGMPLPAVNRSAGETLYGFTKKMVVVLLPPLTSLEQRNAAAQDLISIHDRPEVRGFSWTLDFSRAHPFKSYMFMGLIKSLHENLQQQGRQLKIVWLKKDSFPEQFIDCLSRTLDLVAVGDYLFSRWEC